MDASSPSPQVWVKVCGLRDLRCVRAAVTAGADAVGFVFAAGSVRTISLDTAQRLVTHVPTGVERVGVFRNQSIDDVLRIANTAGLSTVQLHGAEPDGDFDILRQSGFRSIQALSVADVNSGARSPAPSADMLLLDSESPGSGHRPPSLTASPESQWILAGGLTPDNVAAAITEIRPWGVDVSSGVEITRGMKDPALIEGFIHAAHSAHLEGAAHETLAPRDR